MANERIVVLLQRQDLSSFLFSVFIYFLLVTAQLIYSVDAPSHIQVFVKCLPLSLLIVYVYRVQGSFNAIKHNSEGLKILLGLIASVVGDGILVYQNLSVNYFITGAVLFLLAHILYMSAFQWKRFDFPTFLVCFVLVIATAYGILVILTTSLDPSLQALIIIYTSTIYLMAWRSWARINFVKGRNDRLHVYAGIGSFSFVISDTLLAINKFVFFVPGSYYSIMATYYTAQFFIAISTPKPHAAFGTKKKIK